LRRRHAAGLQRDVGEVAAVQGAGLGESIRQDVIELARIRPPSRSDVVPVSEFIVVSLETADSNCRRRQQLMMNAGCRIEDARHDHALTRVGSFSHYEAAGS
jgi:hypothetical protein